MYRIVICDDEKKILENITQRVRIGFEQAGICAQYTSLSDARELAELLERQNVDILFLDIDMPCFSGMDIAKMITEKERKTLLVFVTSYDALVYQTFAYRPFGFIRKSYFDKEIDEVIERLKKELFSWREELILQKGQEIIKIPVDDIYYIESNGNYINMYRKSGEEKYRETMTRLEDELKGKNFVRCHKGYLVNSKYISRMRNNEMELTDGRIIPIGRSYESKVKQTILELMRK